MLALLAAPSELERAGPFAINLNVASILAPEFQRFDAALPAVLRGEVTLDLLPADILSDPSAFLFARDFARARGFRLMLRGVTADVLPMFPLRLLGLDLIELRWSRQMREVDLMDLARQVVLSRADTPDAIDWAAAQGIGFFKGAMAQAGRRFSAPARMEGATTP